MFHVTPKKNVAKILKEGLISPRGHMIYLSQNPDSWRTAGHVVFKVDVTGYMLTSIDEGLDEYILWTGHVDPSRIMLVHHFV